MNAETYARRRAELVSQIGNNDIVIVATSPVRSRNSDVDYQFRADSDFYYLSGFAEPDAVLVICPGRARGEYVMFCREKDRTREMWDGRRIGLEGVIESYGADDAFPIEDINDILPGLMEEKEKVFTSVGRYPDFDAQLLGWMNQDKRLGTHAPYEFVDLNHILHEQRLIKRPDEIALMRKAGKMSAAGHARAMQVCRPGLFEYQVQAEMEPGMVFTVEPDIYVNPADNVDQRWHHIGIRIEDNILVRRDGYENLTESAPKKPSDIEALMAS